MLKNVKIFEIGPLLDLPVCDQSFTTYAPMCNIARSFNVTFAAYDLITKDSKTLRNYSRINKYANSVI